MIFNFNQEILNKLYDEATKECPIVQVAAIEGDVLVHVTINGSTDLDKPALNISFDYLTRDINISKYDPQAISLYPGLLDWANINITSENPLYCSLYHNFNVLTNDITYDEIIATIEKEYQESIHKKEAMLAKLSA